MIDNGNYAEKLRKAVYNCIAIAKGSFAFNPQIGSRLAEVHLLSNNFEKECEQAVREAIIQCGDAEYEGINVETDGEYSFCVSVRYRYMGKIYETEKICING